MEWPRLFRSEKTLAKWKATRALGRERFVWRVGVCYWGGLMCATMFAFEMTLPDTTFSWMYLLRSVLMWAALGYAWGAGTWALNEKIYLRYAK